MLKSLFTSYVTLYMLAAGRTIWTTAWSAGRLLGAAKSGMRSI